MDICQVKKDKRPLDLSEELFV